MVGFASTRTTPPRFRPDGRVQKDTLGPVIGLALAGSASSMLWFGLIEVGRWAVSALL